MMSEAVSISVMRRFSPVPVAVSARRKSGGAMVGTRCKIASAKSPSCVASTVSPSTGSSDGGRAARPGP